MRRPLLALLALLAAPAALAQIPGDLEFDEPDRFGNALATGDFNGDFSDDLVVGVYFESVGNTTEQYGGAVNVIYGTPVGGLDDAGAQYWHQDSPGIGDAAEDLDWFGSALAVGDFDGDGFDDLAVSAPYEDRDSTDAVGQLHVFYGSAAGITSAGSFFLPNLPVQTAFLLLGHALAAGDFDGDGFDDLALGLPGFNVGAAAAAGLVAVLFGTANGITTQGYQRWHQNTAGILDQAETNDHFGWTLAAGDFDRDGFDDLAVGVPQEDVNGQANAGAVQALYGTANGLAAARN
ncbi:MAG: FG-GAP repeat protein, partial [Rubricoccaceae bacterium]|nr:FG-GAP repeat protein [Rubricoccaceae bacterium]